MLPEGCICQCSQSDCIRIFESIVSADNTRKFPLGSYIFMFTSGMLRVFIYPAWETSYVTELLPLILLISLLQKSLQYLQVQPLLLDRIVCSRFVSPGRKVKEECLLAHKKVMIGQLMVIRHCTGRISTPELVYVIGCIFRIAQTFFQVLLDKPDIRIYFQRACRKFIRSGNLTSSREERRTVFIHQPAFYG